MKRVPIRSPLAHAQDHVLDPARGDDDLGAAAARQVGCGQLGAHAARAQPAAGAAGARPQVVVDGGHLADQLGARVGARIGRVQARLIGEYQQQVGLDQVGHQRRQRVVVAQLDLVGSDRVVFVDHGHDALGQQRLQGIAGVEVAAAVVEIGPRQQHLAHDDVVDAEELLVVLHQPDLADGGQHLFGGHGLRRAGESPGSHGRRQWRRR